MRILPRVLLVHGVKFFIHLHTFYLCSYRIKSYCLRILIKTKKLSYSDSFFIFSVKQCFSGCVREDRVHDRVLIPLG